MAGCRKSKQSGRGPAFEPGEWQSRRGRPKSGRRAETKNNKRSDTRETMYGRGEDADTGLGLWAGRWLHTPFVIATVGAD
jgi:hypothetical protein